jgi:transcriptional regulator with XRE-family HTH domain
MKTRERLAFQTHVGRQVRFRREALDWTMRDLAAASGVAVAAVSNVENGLASMTIWTAVRISLALGCTLNDLVDGHAVLAK